MADENEPLEIPIDVPGAEEAISEMQRVRAAAKGMGDGVEKSSAGARLAMWGFGEQAQNAAEKLGLPFQMSRRLGNTIEDMGRSLGKGAIAFGALGLAATAAVMVYSHFADANEKAHEELVKEADQLYASASALSEYKFQTIQALEAKKKSAEHDRKEFIGKNAELIRQETEKLKDLEKAAKNTGATFKELGKFAWEELTGEQTLEASRKRLNKIDDERNSKLQKQLDIVRELKEKQTAAMGGGDYAADIALVNKSRRDARNEDFDNLVKNNERERKERVAAWNDNMVMLKSRSDYTIAEAKRVADAETRLNEMRWASANSTAGNMSQAFSLMYRMGGENARKYFSMYKLASQAEVIISTARAIMKAMAQDGPLGWIEAGSLAALGAAQLATIQKQSFDGGANSAPTFSASPATGLPSINASNGGSQTFVINVNGKRAGEFQTVGDILRQIYNAGGSVDGFSVDVARA